MFLFFFIFYYVFQYFSLRFVGFVLQPTLSMIVVQSIKREKVVIVWGVEEYIEGILCWTLGYPIWNRKKSKKEKRKKKNEQ